MILGSDGDYPGSFMDRWIDWWGVLVWNFEFGLGGEVSWVGDMGMDAGKFIHDWRIYC